MSAKKPTHEVHRVENHEGDWANHGLVVGEVVSEGTADQCRTIAEQLRATEQAERPADSLGYRYVVHPYGTA